MRVGLFGGSFDPPHRGHVEPVLAAQRALGLDRVLYLPTARPPHKSDREQTPPHRRYAMVELALLAHRALEVSALELTPGRVAYTVDTVEELGRRHPGDRFVLLVGADSFVQLPSWRRWLDLARAVEIGVLARPGWDLDALPADAPEELRRLATAERVHRVAQPPLAISSTELRRRLARGEAPSAGALDDLVLRYITKYALYR